MVPECDLCAWSVSEVSPGRSLVQAAHLAPWYAGDAPEPGVVEAARADFGGMIMSAGTIAELGGHL